jgi:hypothetical protein
MPEECADGQTQDQLYTNGYGGYDNASWTITNLMTGEEWASGGFSNSYTPNFMCFDDGVYEVTLCDTEDDYDDSLSFSQPYI